MISEFKRIVFFSVWEKLATSLVNPLSDDRFPTPWGVTFMFVKKYLESNIALTKTFVFGSIWKDGCKPQHPRIDLSLFVPSKYLQTFISNFFC